MMTSNGIPCDSVYDVKNDYVYISSLLEMLEPLRVIAEYEHQYDVIGCPQSTLRMVCQLYLPPCGNSTHFEPPISVCSHGCYLQNHICPTYWENWENLLFHTENNLLSCSRAENIIPNSCSDRGVFTCELTAFGKEVFILTSLKNFYT